MTGIVYELVLDEMNEEILKILEELLRESGKDKKPRIRPKRSKRGKEEKSTTKQLMICDSHYKNKVFRDIDEFKA